ncbi:polysaccharide biosynthesis/export family protein [Gymnodinialimonas sp. 2305UL16-5]|uniref:polysaccharide biosynthesis/export family protein n=1 Tax=Gymnodinialimonas mytili TaxID=3126503 RepID=UPI0030B7D261
MKRLLLALAGLFLMSGTVVAQQSYQIRPGDVLSVEVLQDPALNREVLVLPDGSFSFPFAGTLFANGQTVAQVQQRIASGIAPNFAVEPNVFVTVRQTTPVTPTVRSGPTAPPTIEIYFLGEVNSPGLIEVAPGTTILQGLAQSGGFTSFAATRRLQLRRTDPHTGQQSLTELNYRALERGARLSRDIPLADGDVILVPERGLFE